MNAVPYLILQLLFKGVLNYSKKTTSFPGFSPTRRVRENPGNEVAKKGAKKGPFHHLA